MAKNSKSVMRFTCIGCKKQLDFETAFIKPGGGYPEAPKPWITNVFADFRPESSGVQVEVKFAYCSEECAEAHDPAEGDVLPPGITSDAVHEEIDRSGSRRAGAGRVGRRRADPRAPGREGEPRVARPVGGVRPGSGCSGRLANFWPTNDDPCPELQVTACLPQGGSPQHDCT